MTQEYYKSFNTREEEVTRSKRSIALRQVEMDRAPTEKNQTSKEYEQLRTEIMHVVEERTRRIEEKIDRQLMEHKRQIEIIIELLTRKTGPKIGNKMTKKLDRVEEYRSEDSEGDEDSLQ